MKKITLCLVVIVSIFIYTYSLEITELELEIYSVLDDNQAISEILSKQRKNYIYETYLSFLSSASFVLKDKDNYQWYNFNFNHKNKLYRYNGMAFDEYDNFDFRFNTENYMYLVYDNKIYRSGDILISGLTLSADEILQSYFVNDNNKVFISTNKRYLIFSEDGEIRYFDGISINNQEWIFTDSKGLLKEYISFYDHNDIFYKFLFNLEYKTFRKTFRTNSGEEGLHIAHYFRYISLESDLYTHYIHHGIKDSTMILSTSKLESQKYIEVLNGKKRIDVDKYNPTFSTRKNNNSVFFIKNTDLIWELSDSKTFNKISVPESVRILSVVTLKESNYLLFSNNNIIYITEFGDNFIYDEQKCIKLLNNYTNTNSIILYDNGVESIIGNIVEDFKNTQINNRKLYKLDTSSLSLEEIIVPEYFSDNYDLDANNSIIYELKDLSEYYSELLIYNFKSEKKFKKFLEKGVKIIDIDMHNEVITLLSNNVFKITDVNQVFNVVNNIDAYTRFSINMGKNELLLYSNSFEKTESSAKFYQNNKMINHFLFDKARISHYCFDEKDIFLYYDSRSFADFTKSLAEDYDLFRYNLDNKEKQKISLINSNDERVHFFKNKIAILSADSLIIHKKNLQNDGNYLVEKRYNNTQIFKNIISNNDSLLISNILQDNDFWLVVLSENEIFFNQLYFQVEDYINDYWEELNSNQAFFDSNNKFICPPFIVNLSDFSISFKPFWTGVNQINDNLLISHIETEPDKKITYNVSKYYHNHLQNLFKTEYLKENYRGFRVINSTLANDNSFYIYQSTDNMIYYQYNNQWQSLNLKDFSYLQRFINASIDSGFLYCWFEYGLLKHNIQDGNNYVIELKNGYPVKVYDVFKSNDETFMLTDNKIIQFNEDTKAPFLNIPYFFNKGEKWRLDYNHKFSFEDNNINIPIHILNKLYPEDCYLNYKLSGFDDDYKLVNYSSSILYEKLSPGRYNFSIKAISQFGIESETINFSFQIKPPFYKTIWAYIIYTLLLSALLRFLYIIRTEQLKRKNKELELQVTERTKELTLKSNELIERQRLIQESIEYAALIQCSILPQDSDLSKVFSEYFIYWKPRDVVGGDFYWFYQVPKSDNILLAVIDCTGHGVPGALLSMTAYHVLNNIVKGRCLYCPSEILMQMHKDIGYALNQEKENTQQDGVAISIINLSMEKKQMTFAGAGQNLVYFNYLKNEIELIRGSKYSIAGLRLHKEIKMDDIIINYNYGDKIYLFTDGIIDQPGISTSRTKRFGTNNWLDLITDFKEYSVQKQYEVLDKSVNSMLKAHEQRDDLTIIGVQLS